MSTLPFAFFATSEDPIRCDECHDEKEHGAFIEFQSGRLVCHCCLADALTAIDELYRISHPVTYPQAKEARDV